MATPGDAGMIQEKWTVHIEVRLKPVSTARIDTLRKCIKQFIEQDVSIYFGSRITGWDSNAILKQYVEAIYASESPAPIPSIPVEQAILDIHIYQCNDSESFEEFTNGGSSGGEDTSAATVCELPSRGWEGLWDSLVYSDDIKSRLLNYIYATLLLSDAGVDFNIVSWNRVVLLHGPPGTGKTSLCRALAQKLSIRLSDRYTHAKLVEINSHSLFSRWFSESGKLVQRLFASVTEMVDDETTFVVVLIDEVESLTAARAGAMAGTEPSDALRVVNALLTQLDKLKHRKNVLVMSTSNLPKAIDSAYVDRADIVQYVGLPPPEAIYWILRSCINELIKTKVISPVEILGTQEAEALSHLTTDNSFIPECPKDRSQRASARLFVLAEQCQGMSGRSLRRLPVLAHARYIGASAAGVRGASDVEVWLHAMEKVVVETKRGRDAI
ncbi:hypothetical protein BOTBODRAFT_124328 [Botryobasidium botryosum FD-172 SS1]|uniref:AAA+ ATPase domain-containing protein n=1 Tax=Botryobasidium botryosum (strain FD-172 SS1) TaxID=930990 RepID=A0A067N0Z9_BOTB1|nr:hypothetical protein BOTBODRAFT_124328 [Botryobasidium botryosum FD-172 SS1]